MKTEEFPCVIEARKVVLKQLEFYREMMKEPEPEHLVQSQHSFEDDMRRLNNDVRKRADGSYVDISINPHYILWKKAAALSRKHALEEVISLFADNDESMIEQKIKELLK